MWTTVGVTLTLIVAAYVAVVCALMLSNRREQAIAAMRLIPDLLGLLKRLFMDPRVPLWSKAVLVLGILYLVLPIDLVPDFVPVAGQLDDVLIAGLVVALLIRTAGDEVVADNWRGSDAWLAAVRRLARGGSNRGHA